MNEQTDERMIGSGGGDGRDGGGGVMMMTMMVIAVFTITVMMMLTVTDYFDGNGSEYCCFSVSHLERDLSQKRVLMEDIKLKLTTALENAETDASVMVLRHV